MKGIKTDFVRNGGAYMVIDTEGGLHADQLNEVQRNMLGSVSIPNLLRLDVREINSNVTFHYEITGKRMLTQCLKSDWMTMTEFYSLLLQIAKVLDNSKEYMLSADNHLLDADHIFVEEQLSSGKMYLAYVPMLHISQEHSVAQAMLNLVNRLMTRVTDMEGNGIQKIISLCGGERFSVSGLKNLLTSLLLVEDPDPSVELQGSIIPIRDIGRERELAPPEVSMQQSFRSTHSAALAAQKSGLNLSRSSGAIPDKGPHRISDRNPDRSLGRGENRSSNRGRLNEWPDSASLYVEALTVGEEAEEARFKEGKAGGRTEIKPAYIWIGTVLLVALIWKFIYLDRPSDVGLYVGTGSSLVVVIIAIFINSRNFDPVNLFRGRGNGEGGLQFDDKASDSIEVRQQEHDLTDRGKLHRYEEKWRWNATSPALSPSPKPLPGFSESIQTQGSEMRSPSVEADPPAVFPIPAASATVLLKNLSPPGHLQGGSVNYLEKLPRSGVGPERIPLSKGSFIIGRSEDLAQYVEKEAGVSRAHVELTIRETGCSIKDLGSRNGTKLNGELLAPYKDYPLEPGDSFTIAEITFRYSKENQNSA